MKKMTRRQAFIHRVLWRKFTKVLGALKEAGVKGTRVHIAKITICEDYKIGDIGTHYCVLCKVYRSDNGGCFGCPIDAPTGETIVCPHWQKVLYAEKSEAVKAAEFIRDIELNVESKS